MKSDRLVSVIVPCFNQGRYLGEALDSVLAQSYRAWECIIVNDGSTDETQTVAERYCRRDPRIRYVAQPNAGVSAARNAALEIAAGDLILFLDADDFVLPEAMAIMVRALGGNRSLALAYCNWCWAQQDGVPIMKPSKFSDPTLLMERPLLDMATRWETELSIPIHAFLFDASIFRDHLIRFDTSLPTHSDWDCWLRVFALRPAIVKVPETLAVYRLHDQGLTQNLRKMAEGVERICDKYRAGSDREFARHIALKQVAMRRHYRRLRARERWESLPPSMLRRWEKHVPWPIQRVVYRLIMP